MASFVFKIRDGATSANSEHSSDCGTLDEAEAFAATLLASKVEAGGPPHRLMDAVIRDDGGTVLSCVSMSVTTLRSLR